MILKITPTNGRKLKLLLLDFFISWPESTPPHTLSLKYSLPDFSRPHFVAFKQ